MVNSICFTVLINQNFILFFHKYLFNISITAILQLRILQNSFFAKHLSLTAFDLYDAHLDDSGLEYTFWLQNIFCANEEAIFLGSSVFFSELNKGRAGLIWWLQTTLRPIIILVVQNLINILEKHAASVKSLKFEVPVESNTSYRKYTTWVGGSICVIFNYP